MRRLLEQRGFQVVESRGVPAPYPLAMGDNRFSRILLAVNSACLRLLPSLFSYQLLMVAEPKPSLELLLQHAVDESSARANAMAAGSR